MNRSLVGNFLILTFLVLAASGAVMYFFSFEKSMAATHTLFALLFVLSIALHIVNNKVPLKNYLLGKRSKHLAKYQSLILIVLLSFIGLGAYLDMPVINELYNWGNELRNAKAGKTEATFEYQMIQLNSDIPGAGGLEIEVKKGEAFQYPLFAIWVEDSKGQYLETLYVSRVIASGVYDYGVEIDGVWTPSSKRRPEALPYWSHKRNIRALDGFYIPLEKALDLDGVSGATPTDNFIVKSRAKSEHMGSFRIMMEVNQSYDWNEYYNRNQFPDDKIYSGSGQVGQPALIYQSELFHFSGSYDTYSLMKLIGHGHHSGQDGKLYSNLSQITTAKDIVDRVIVKRH
ncbi:MAG: hypothetical protein ABJH72_09560 [Reichenbachiella sp.]|uniref:hypothetical protein n=1 Tax=Reichenbachiella sp. TaxID=2184521 RepID=UPI0032677F21